MLGIDLGNGRRQVLFLDIDHSVIGHRTGGDDHLSEIPLQVFEFDINGSPAVDLLRIGLVADDRHGDAVL